MKTFAAHLLREDTEDPSSKVLAVQTIISHANGVAEKAAIFAKPFRGEEQAIICGLSHDIGKYSKGFQHRIWENGPKVDHSSAGAQELIKQASLASLICAYCVAGHHSGLMDYSTLNIRLQKQLKRDLDYSDYGRDIEISSVPIWQCNFGEAKGFTIFFFTRMLFSCLVDADYLDTECFMNPDIIRKATDVDVLVLNNKFNKYIEEKNFLLGRDGINYWRSNILRRCIEQGKCVRKGVYTLTVPTGGGKTISSLAFALNHAVRNKQNRIIYVVPYCAIIDQTVDVFNKILGSENVLAHYSEAVYEEDDMYEIKRLATENWDMPVIVTTAVQFFESLFSSKTSKCRKVHNIANSVIIFDEAQTVPREYMDPCLCAMAELSLNYNSTCVLCTATQPSVKERFERYYPNTTITEICENPEKLYCLFKRVSYKKIGRLSDEQLCERLLEYEQVLCIVSTRAQAKNVFALLPKEGRIHLSTLMTPEHRKKAIREIKERISGGKICRVIATSLIEAGVDIDFPVVFRGVAGLDSIIQAGGRCNREGNLKNGLVYVFEPDMKYKLPAMLKRPAEVTNIVVNNNKDIASPEVIEKYFSTLCDLEKNAEGALDRYNIVTKLNENVLQKDFCFETIDQSFNFISDQGIRVVFVPEDDESHQIADMLKLKKEKIGRHLFRKLSKHCVNIYERQYRNLLPALYAVDESLAILEIPEEYDEETGLKFNFEGGDGIFG